jgi:hypothetical protein
MRVLCVVVLLLLTGLWTAFGEVIPKEHPDVKAATVKYEHEVFNAIKPIEKRYLARLELLQKELTRKRDFDGAQAAKTAIDRLKAMPTSSQLGDTIEGTWRVDYSNGNSRTYLVSADGSVRFIEGANTGKITWNEDAWLIDFGDGKFERAAVKRVLEIEHYTSQAEFDSRKPSVSGTGTRKE